MTAVEKQEELLRIATHLLEQKPDWATFYREVMGKEGLIRNMFPTLEEQAEFERSEAYKRVQQMLRELREKGPLPPENEEPTKVITVRLPRSMHEALWEEAHLHRTSINKLCISKLLQLIDNELVPPERKR
ncbi:MAG: toxin-antitoxin system HicB family antitoxin [Planctomycetota bacterium]